jgi:hypothetical protein
MLAPRTPIDVLTPLRLKFSRTPGKSRTLRRKRNPMKPPRFAERVEKALGKPGSQDQRDLN